MDWALLLDVGNLIGVCKTIAIVVGWHDSKSVTVGKMHWFFVLFWVLKLSHKFNLLKSYRLFLIFSITINLVTTSITVPLIMIFGYNGKYAFALCRPLNPFSSNISSLIPIHFVFFAPYRQCLVLLIIIITILFRLLCHSYF